jgi:transposase
MSASTGADATSHPLTLTESRGQPRLFVGIDLGRWLHVVSVVDGNGELVAERGFAHSVEGLATIIDWLIDLAEQNPKRIWVAIEKPHGAVVETLLIRGIAVFAVNPKQVDRFRDRFALSGAKDDRRDAFVLADALRTDGHRFQPLSLPPPDIIVLREHLRSRSQLVKQHVALSSQLRELIVGCWPQLLELAPKNKAVDVFFAELLLLFFDIDNANMDSLRALIQKHRIRRVSFDDVIRTLHAPTLCVAPGTLDAAQAHATLLVQQLLLVIRLRRHADQFLERWFKKHQQRSDRELTDAAILASLPGVGALVLASLLCYANDALRLRSLDALRSLGGVAPVTKQSGKRRQVLLRRARSQPLNFALHHWAHMAVLRDSKSEQHYRRLRNKGHSHARSLRGVIDRLLSVAIAMLRDRALYDPSKRKEVSS